MFRRYPPTPTRRSSSAIAENIRYLIERSLSAYEEREACSPRWPDREQIHIPQPNFAETSEKTTYECREKRHFSLDASLRLSTDNTGNIDLHSISNQTWCRMKRRIRYAFAVLGQLLLEQRRRDHKESSLNMENLLVEKEASTEPMLDRMVDLSQLRCSVLDLALPQQAIWPLAIVSLQL